MAYRSPTEADQVFEAYLSGASFGNVVMEEPFGIADPVQRWRLVCKKCGATLTYSDVSSAIMAEKYRFESILDDKVSKFCKAHCHQVKHETAKMYDLKSMMNELVLPLPIPTAFEVYLNDASFGNIVMKESSGIDDSVQRWWLVCKKCGATVAYSDLLAKVSEFCKAHAHQVKHETAKMYDLTAAEAKAKFDALPVKKPLPIQIVKLVPAPIKVPEPVLPAPLPMKKLGRRIR